MTETITWITPTGTTIPFDGTAGLRLIEGPANRFAPPVNLSTDETPGVDGAHIRSTKYGPRTIDVAIGVEGSTATECRSRLRTLLQATAADRGAGTLRFVAPGGDTRDITAIYQGGFEGDDTNADPALTDYPFVVQFYAADPLFQASADSTDSWTVDSGVPFFPIFPLQLSSSEVFAAPSITNAGDVETYPVWTITGPGSVVRLSHVATGRVLAWDGTLGVGEVLTLDARGRGQSTTPKAALLQDGSNVFELLSAWDFFPLAVGSQTVQIEMSGADANSAVSARWRHRYYGA